MARCESYAYTKKYCWIDWRVGQERSNKYLIGRTEYSKASNKFFAIISEKNFEAINLLAGPTKYLFAGPCPNIYSIQPGFLTEPTRSEMRTMHKKNKLNSIKKFLGRLNNHEEFNVLLNF